MLKSQLILVMSLVSFSVFAQTSTTSLSQSHPAMTKNLLSVDAFPVFLSGVGIAYDRVLLPRSSVGIYGNFENLKSNNSGDNLMSLQTFGIRSRYYLTGEAADQGLYLSGALVNVSLKATVQVQGVEGTGSDKKTGFIGGAGYQILGRESSLGKFVMNFGVLAGTGYGAEYTGRLSSKGVTSVEASIKNGVGAEASLGFLF